MEGIPGLKNVLIICESFPPQSYVGGVRPAMMAKYLPEFGWQPHILTRDYGFDHACRNELMAIEGLPPKEFVKRVEVSLADENKYLSDRSLLQKIRDIITVERSSPPGVFDKIQAEINDYYNDKSIDLIWATAPGFVPLRMACDLSKSLGVPWVADFRDISEQEVGMPRSFREKILVLRSNIRRSQLISSASYLTSVSKYHCKMLERKLNKRCQLIYNGYEEISREKVHYVRSEQFTITYCGRILSQWYRDPTLLFQALDELANERNIDLNLVRIKFIGTDQGLLHDIASSYQSFHAVEIWDRIPFSEVPQQLINSELLLILTNIGRHGVLTTKLFEYLPIKRHILCINCKADGEIAQILDESDAGLAADSVQDVKQYILKLYSMWMANKTLAIESDDEIISQFSRRSQAKCLAHHFDEIIRNETTA
jgi:hypothetical protein